MCRAIDAAIYLINEIIDLEELHTQEKYEVDIFKVHKLLYYAQGFMLAQHDKVIFKENIRAHRCGPYVDGLDSLDFYVEDKIIYKKINFEISIPLNKEQKDILNKVARKYGYLDTEMLINKSKAEKPYKSIWEKFISTENDFEKYAIYTDNKLYPIIPIDLIKSYFKELSLTI